MSEERRAEIPDVIVGVHAVEPVEVVGADRAFAADTVFKAIEAATGFRLTPELTFRSDYTRQAYGGPTWERQIGAQIVWSRRWW